MKTIGEKLGIKLSSRAIAIGAPSNFLEIIGMADLKLSRNLTGKFNYIHLFAKNQAQLHSQFLRLKDHLESDGMLWVSWIKKARGITDLSLPKIIEIGYDYGLVESKSISFNEDWSAIKFTFPKPGKTYNNSFGKLKQ